MLQILTPHALGEGALIIGTSPVPNCEGWRRLLASLGKSEKDDVHRGVLLLHDVGDVIKFGLIAVVERGLESCLPNVRDEVQT